ncbi:hypothetical protein EW145_g4080 [Phellinidium pouzarii]|uniref:Uncharacterized protein n=1 Tax=Phellinidium pouzarii TaxID=167371 RepID=A0A4S4L524_9AGAM|nr:hypothetical protein EW145_g4080 [Phellinidium pouzarii]
MAPYIHFNDTLPRSLSVLPAHALLLPGPRCGPNILYISSSIILSSPTPTTILSTSTTALFHGELPYLGVGPVVLQPSPTQSFEAISADPPVHNHPTKLGYVGIAGVVIFASLASFFFVRSRAFGHSKQRPAEYPEPPMRMLRSQIARAREDVVGHVHQLPRDRIRAMNTVPKAPPSSEYQDIYSPFPVTFSSYGLPLLNPEPDSPMTSTLSRDSTIVPPTPTTVKSLATMIDRLQPPLSPEIAQQLPEVRYSWDFRCRGLYRFALGAVLDISRANSIPEPCSSPVSDDAEGTDSHKIRLDTVEDALSFGFASGSRHETQDEEMNNGGIVGVNMDSAISRFSNDTLAAIFNISFEHNCVEDHMDTSSSKPTPSQHPSDNSSLSLCDESTLDMTSSTVFLDTSSSGLSSQKTICNGEDRHLLLNGTVRTSAIEVSRGRKEEEDQVLPSVILVPTESLTCSRTLMSAPEKSSKKRFVLSKPNHRTLVPTSSTLKLHACPSTASVNAMSITGVSPSQLSKPSDITSKSFSGLPSNVGVNYSMSEANITLLGYSAMPPYLPWGYDNRDAVLPLPADKLFGKDSALTCANFKSSKGALRSSISMPLCVELACLSSLMKRRHKFKFD